uniref:Uncharacterized protein n=1 Tax=Panagrellus redivivus TaxID=6233 RepID=A0A7E4VDK6_PANRE
MLANDDKDKTEYKEPSVTNIVVVPALAIGGCLLIIILIVVGLIVWIRMRAKQAMKRQSKQPSKSPKPIPPLPTARNASVPQKSSQKSSIVSASDRSRRSKAPSPSSRHFDVSTRSSKRSVASKRSVSSKRSISSKRVKKSTSAKASKKK